MLALELLLLLDLELMARDVLTKLRWLRRLNMMMLCNVTTPMTRGVTPPMSPTMSPSRKRSVKKYTPITGCTKEPRELCAPAGCGFTQGEEKCYDKVQTVVQDKPKEECSLEPQRDCKHVTKLVPKLEPTEECVDVPKEVCTRSRTNPH